MTQAPWALTAHAAQMLRERDIEPAWVTRVLDAPDRVEEDRADNTLQHALAPIAERDGRVLRVVHRHAGGTCLVVSAYFDRTEARKLRP